jgi:hypothetical protein
MCTEKCFKLTRRGALVGGTAVAVSAAIGGVAQAGERDHRHPGFPHGRRGLLDLTHPLTTTIPPFAPGEEPKRRTVVNIDPDGYYMQEWTLIEHIGTHVDAPGHFIEGGRLATELEPSELIVEAVVVDISRRAAHDLDTVVTVDDLRAFERRHGRIPHNSAVLMDSGWGARSTTRRPTEAPTPTGSCTSPGSGPRPPSGCCAGGGSAPSGSTPSASTRGSPRSSRPI